MLRCTHREANGIRSLSCFPFASPELRNNFPGSAISRLICAAHAARCVCINACGAARLPKIRQAINLGANVCACARAAWQTHFALQNQTHSAGHTHSHITHVRFFNLTLV